ncbi:MAG TPA: isocitrate lyase/phosphoenolpyruvate mutase family protein, partial [Archangium sp.]
MYDAVTTTNDASPHAKLHSQRFEGITRNYSQADVEKLRGSIRISYTLAEMGSKRLWELLNTKDYVHALGALTGNQAVQMVRAGLEAIYLSGWQVAADANTAGQMYPDQSLYPVDSVPNVVRRINSALRRADQIDHAEGKRDRYWFAPIMADAEAGFGGPLNAYELMKALIEAGASGVHFEDQLASEKKCGHMGGKVLVPANHFIRTLTAARLAADANTAGQMYPDQSLYPVDSVPNVVRRINASLRRADQIDHAEGRKDRYWFAPIMADAEAGFGGPLNAYELMKALIEAGASGVHFEDQLASEKKCGHMGGKVLVPANHFIRTLTAARLAADVLDVPTILVARTDADSAKLLMSDSDEYDHAFIDRKASRTAEGFYRLKGGVDCAIARGLAYAPFADLIWCETSTPDLAQAKKFAEGIRAKFPN